MFVLPKAIQKHNTQGLGRKILENTTNYPVMMGRAIQSPLS